MTKGSNGPEGGSKGGMMQQLQRLQEQLAKAQARLAEETVTASVGGGAIKITMTGDQHCKTVEIALEFLKTSDAKMLQDLILAVVNMALDRSRELQQKMLGPMAGSLPL